MSNKVVIAIVAIVVVAVVAIAAFVVLNNDKGSDTPGYSEFNVAKTKNLVFGNANNDNYLDKTDLEFIQSIVDKKTVWDNDKYPLADTNADGIVNGDDVTLLKKILNGESCTVHYINWYKDKASVLYPVVGPITVDYSTAYDMFVILGCLDKVVGTRDNANLIANYNERLYPGLKSHCVCISNDANVMDPVKIFATGSKLVLGDPYDATDELAAALKRMDSSINIMQLPVNRVMNDIDYTHTIVTLGVLMNRQSYTANYIKYVEQVEEQIKNSIVESGAATKSMIIAYNPSSPNSISLDCLSTFVMQYTDVMNSLKLPFYMPVDRVARERGGMYTNLEMAKIMEIDPDVIILDTYNLAGADITPEEYYAIVKEKVEYFKETRAYKENHIITIAFEVIGGTAGIACLPLIGTYIWGDATFDEDKSWDYINNYYRNFTNMGKNVDMSEVTGYAPEVWGATI
jgi:ABC-type Fe3+-hydroxamate transport system substrate-binding protein